MRVRVVAMFVVLIAVSCGSAGGPQTPRVGALGATANHYTGRGPKVVILGDSLTVLGWNDLYKALDRHYSVVIAAWYGEGFEGGPLSRRQGKPILLTAASIYARTHPSVAVLALGSNEALHDVPIDAALTAMRTMVAEMRPACLVGVTIPSRVDAVRWSTPVADALNRAMRTWANEVVDWATLSRRAGVLGPDHVHTTSEGTALRASAIATAVHKCAGQ